MKEEESLLDVLVYLFEHYFYDEPNIAIDRDSLNAQLVQAGFAPTEILKAFNWLDELEQRRPSALMEPRVQSGPVRVYATQEVDRLDNDCRGFLMFLEQSGVLNAEQRELVIDRAMALELEEVDLTDLKWVVLMVLFNQPGQEAAFAWIESELLEDGGETPH